MKPFFLFPVAAMALVLAFSVHANSAKKQDPVAAQPQQRNVPKNQGQTIQAGVAEAGLIEV